METHWKEIMGLLYLVLPESSYVPVFLYIHFKFQVPRKNIMIVPAGIWYSQLYQGEPIICGQGK